MKQYVWLNPVVLSLYEKEELYATVAGQGYEIVSCQEDMIEKVRKKYEAFLQQSSRCVMDMRCPAAVAHVREHYPHAQVEFPEIWPILIHCAVEMSKRYHQDGRLTITTPCRELKDQGNQLRLSNTRFLTWLEFMEENQLHILRKEVDVSPIPPGFFSSLDHAAAPLSSCGKIDDFFSQKLYKDKKVAEMLYCTEGCHNGNGV